MEERDLHVSKHHVGIQHTRPNPYRVRKTPTPSQKYIDLQIRPSSTSSRKRSAADALLVRDNIPALSVLTRPSVLDTQPRGYTTASSSPSLPQFEHTLKQMILKSKVRQQQFLRDLRSNLPKMRLPVRGSSHWDNLLQEMSWMASDFAEERKWKQIARHHTSRDLINALNEDQVRQERQHHQIAKDIARRVSSFWRTMERAATRSQVRLEGTHSRPPEVMTNIGSTPHANLDYLQKYTNTSELHFKWMDVNVPDETSAQRIEDAQKMVHRILQIALEAQKHFISDSNPTLITCSKASHLAPFQVAALRWLLHMSSQGVNVFFNDQVGMGQASVLSAFLSLSPSPRNGPHLIITPDDQVYKWCSHLREWHPNQLIQVYDPSDTQLTEKELLERMWYTSDTNVRDDGEDSFLFVREFYSDINAADNCQTLFCCICPVSVFLREKAAFITFERWQTLIVETENLIFESEVCIQTLQSLQCTYRIICSSKSLPQWKSEWVSVQYAAFLLGIHNAREWLSLSLESSTVLNAFQTLFRSFHPSPSEKATPMNALLFCLYCLRLGRARGHVEGELRNVQEQSVPCTLTSSQAAQYRSITSNFLASIQIPSRHDRTSAWLELFLSLRLVCNSSDLVHFDMDKLGCTDQRALESTSCKLQALGSLLRRIISKQRVVIYCQLSMFALLEVYLSFLQLPFVVITGSNVMQQRALRHFALRPAVRIAVTSTRLAVGTQCVPLYGAQAFIVLDSDWNSVCDAKLRASWAQVAAASALEVIVYRFHCEQTIESALLRNNCVLSAKVFMERSVQEVLALPSEWIASHDAENLCWNLKDTLEEEELSVRMRHCEAKAVDFEDALDVSAEIDAEEHLLLAITEELAPIEWYAVYRVQSMANSRRNETLTYPVSALEAEESIDIWREQETHSLFYDRNVSLEEAFAAISNAKPIRFSVCVPPEPAIRFIETEGIPSGTVRVTYRVPAVVPNVKEMGGMESKARKKRVKTDQVKRDQDLIEFVDDEFWGDTNLDALDSGSWDDIGLGSILNGSLSIDGTEALSRNNVKKKQKITNRRKSSSDYSWNTSEDTLLRQLCEYYGPNWTLVAQTLHSMSVSRYCYRRPTPRQCSERYGKVVKNGNTSLTGFRKPMQINGIGVPESEMLVHVEPECGLFGCFDEPKAFRNIARSIGVLAPIQTSFEGIVQSMKKQKVVGTEVEVKVPVVHNSQTEIIRTLSGNIVCPMDVIRRNRETEKDMRATTIPRNVSPLSASGDAIVGAAFGTISRQRHVTATDTGTKARTSAPSTNVPNWNEGTMGPSVGLIRSTSMPMNTSTLLYVLDHMPEIKNQIQMILNRSNCSEAQKVAMIAELLSFHTNVPNETAAQEERTKDTDDIRWRTENSETDSAKK